MSITFISGLDIFFFQEIYHIYGAQSAKTNMC